MNRTAQESRKHHVVTFTIDGIQYTVEDRTQSAADLLELAGLTAADHDLALVVKGKVKKRFADDQIVHIHPGAQYVTIFTGPTPVV